MQIVLGKARKLLSWGVPAHRRRRLFAQRTGYYASEPVPDL